ncbi:MNN4 protein, putative (macronuclear) [Tetrahymena thermophila SB210]|uniref:MNN4 protein, putative n=1 Tax=Tetrahymena thermophila (strain SB210) TaxID=312017 RepID=Q22A88_TETTS|nr:MNN4 protein, putative [Tetrahymena thermophila SB210]EAR82210.1 MNN4 protein, putative [Tetrahymena thermophila SB210]|eukprot:XP_001029873.1 MNN4 protein, putative [Tetrahymena thermophila SB210]
MNFENLKVLQTSFIKLCLNQHKPHLELKEVKFMKKNFQYSQNQIEIYDYGHAKVFDHQEQTQKLLIICLYKGYESQTEFYLRVMKTAVRSDILLNLVKHYYLDDNQLFYVFEMECFDETLNTFQQKHIVDGQIINSLKDQITQYFFKTQEIIQDYKQDLQFYIKYTQQKQLQIKVNLIDPSLSEQQLKQKQNQQRFQSIGEQECEGRLENQDEILVNKQQNLDQSQNKTEIDIEDEEKQNFLEAINYISNSINMQIQKNDLVSSVQHFYSNILNFHPLEIFKTVQECPMYQSFQEISFGEQTFQMKVQKRGQTILLEGTNIKDQQNDSFNFEQNDFGFQIDSFSFQESSEFYVFLIESKIQSCLEKFNKEYSSLNNLRKATGNVNTMVNYKN